MIVTKCNCCGGRPEIINYQIVCECGHSSPKVPSSMRLLIKVWEKMNMDGICAKDVNAVFYIAHMRDGTVSAMMASDKASVKDDMIRLFEKVDRADVVRVEVQI